ncbi:hypothetical protein GCM10009839_49610 [Catenulispora yoronensis]|uniref:Uncharacterized protein n=1 Tax=Catenulispora yoronensis TaxID=450799 RepID=A0ABN2URX8_9ACTN
MTSSAVRWSQIGIIRLLLREGAAGRSIRVPVWSIWIVVSSIAARSAQYPYFDGFPYFFAPAPFTTVSGADSTVADRPSAHVPVT